MSFYKKVLYKGDKTQQEIIEYARKKKATIVGSYAQKTHLPYSRTPEDVDIRVPSKKKEFAVGLAKKLSQRYGRSFRAEKAHVAYRVRDIQRNRYVADVVQVPIKRSEISRVDGNKIATPNYILRGKLAQLAYLKSVKPKVYRDVQDLSPVDDRNPKSFYRRVRL